MKNPTDNTFSGIKGLLKEGYSKKKMGSEAAVPKQVKKIKFKLLEGLNKGNNFTKK